MIKHYLCFGGRTGRVEFLILYVLWQFLLPIVFIRALLYAIPSYQEFEGVKFALFHVVWLASLFFYMTAVCRRLHDMNFSGYWMWLWPPAVLLGPLGWILPVALAVWPGVKNANKYGPAPELLYGFSKKTGSADRKR